MKKAMSNKEYARTMGENCPFCRNEPGDLGIGPDGHPPEWSMDRPEVTQEMVCHDCGKGWTDIFRLVEYEAHPPVPAEARKGIGK